MTGHHVLAGRRFFRIIALFGITIAGLAMALPLAWADDWPAYRHDNARSAVTKETLPSAMVQAWVFTPSYAPEPAWPDPAKEKLRVQFDQVFHPTAAGDAVFFGSSAEGKVYCLDAATGQLRWQALTGGPIRIAPTVSKGRVYVGSDDGCVYCYQASDGALVWQVRAAWRDERVLGSGRMISLWPVRTGVLVDDGVAYFGAGVFPHETLFLCAANAETGDLVWRNDTFGEDGYKLEFGGISPQGPLLATDTTLFVPSGRAMPAAFNKADGTFISYFAPGGKVGGTWALLAGDRLVAGTDQKRAYDADSGKMRSEAVYAWFPGLNLVVGEDTAFLASEEELVALDRNAFADAEKHRTDIDRRRKPLADKRGALDKKVRQATGAAREELKAEMATIDVQLGELDSEQRTLEASVRRWSQPCEHRNALILAGDTLYLGGDGSVKAADGRTGQDLWKLPVHGRACGLAAANGRLLVSTDTGYIYCFAREGGGGEVKQAAPAPWAEDSATASMEAAAEEILARTGVTKGYCLVYGCGTGRLAYELARRSELLILGVDPDPRQVAAARAALDAAGLYGKRVIVDQADLARLPYSNYFANLVVSETMLTTGQPCGVPAELLRTVKPCGGAVCLRLAEAERSWLPLSAEFTAPSEAGPWYRMVRGPLPGAGKWTHQYADPGNTACSDDQRVRGALGVLWYGEPGPADMVERHARAAAPVAMDGRLFVQGEHKIMAYDAYNGMLLWKREIPGAVRVRVDSDMGNLAMNSEGLYVAANGQCLRLDPATGETIRTYELPPAPGSGPRRWGYLALGDGLLYGSVAPALPEGYGEAWAAMVEDDGEWADLGSEAGQAELPAEYKAYLEQFKAQFPKPDEHAFWQAQQAGFLWRNMSPWPAWGSVEAPQGAVTERIMASNQFFALDTETGALRWQYDGGPIAHPAIAMMDGHVFLADCEVTEAEKSTAMDERRKLVASGVWEKETIEYGPQDADVRRVLALDAATGEKKWERVMDLTGCGGDRMGLACKDGALCFFGCFSNHDRDLFLTGKLAWRRVTVVNAQDGSDKWSRPLNYLRRPVIVGDEILIEPRGCALHTGEVKSRLHPLTGANSEWEYVRPGHCCSATSAAPNMFFLRGYFLWYYDLERDQGMLPFGGIRPGCWINTIPANGLVLFPDASAGCTCSYPINATVALEPKRELATWSVCVQNGDQTPVRRLGVNFGAPGDWRDAAGNMWFAYPHPPNTRWHTYGVNFKLKEEFFGKETCFSRNFQGLESQNPDKPWLFASGYQGIRKFSVSLLEPGQGPGVYTVRLYFAEPRNLSPGNRVFSIRLQGRNVEKELDVVKDTGAAWAGVMKEYRGVRVEQALEVELSPGKETPGPDEMPILNGMEVIREDASV